MAILKFTATVYEQKISTLESYAAQLQTHLDNLQDYKNQLFEVWTGEESAQYLKLITDYIVSCKTALERVNGLRTIYQNVSNDMNKTKALIDSNIDEAKSIAKSLGIDGAE